MNAVITGAAGFIGTALTAALSRNPVLRDSAEREYEIGELVLVDLGPPSMSGVAQEFRDRIRVITGDIGDQRIASEAIGAHTGSVFHLAGVVSGSAEADFDLGVRANIDGTRALIEACRAAGQRPRFVFSSSIAVFGKPLPAAIDDETGIYPTLSYGAQKRICEIFLEDTTRRGFIDGRALRLPGIVVRPPARNGALSAFMSDVIREPLAGRDYICPVGPEAVSWLMSVDCCVRNLIHAACLPTTYLGQRRSFNLPCVVASFGEITDALRRLAGDAVARRIDVRRDEALQAQFAALPREFKPHRAESLGFVRDRNVSELILLHARRHGIALPGATPQEMRV